ncbi:hypothetical protein NL349_28130, partial [Klebsiella pneumoniae]|nr:hypothetical protein [Klebsiella pneumoniae]
YPSAAVVSVSAIDITPPFFADDSMPARGAESLFVVSERADRQPGDASRLNVEYGPELKEQHDGELMSETRFHGVRSRENTDLQQAI